MKRGRGRPRKQPKPPEGCEAPVGACTFEPIPEVPGSDMRYSLEIDAEWWTEEPKARQQLASEPSGDGRPPLSVPPRFITLQIRDYNRVTETTRKLCLEHPMWKQLNPSAPPVKIKKEGRRPGPVLVSWKGETPISILLGQNFRQRPAKPKERLDTLPKFRLIITSSTASLTLLLYSARGYRKYS